MRTPKKASPRAGPLAGEVRLASFDERLGSLGGVPRQRFPLIRIELLACRLIRFPVKVIGPMLHQTPRDVFPDKPPALTAGIRKDAQMSNASSSTAVTFPRYTVTAEQEVGCYSSRSLLGSDWN